MAGFSFVATVPTSLSTQTGLSSNV